MKERLLGAAVLIAAAILIIPAFLDGPERPETTSSELALPVPEGDTIESGPDSSRTHTVEINTGRSTSEEKATAAAGSLSPPQAVPQAVSQPVPQAQTAVAEATNPAAAPATKPPAAPPVNKPPASEASWAVQVGSFTSETNARRLMEHLKDAGYPAFVVRNVVNGRVMFRVRVGPEIDRLHAESLAERLKADRQQTQLVRHP